MCGLLLSSNAVYMSRPFIVEANNRGSEAVMCCCWRRWRQWRVCSHGSDYGATILLFYYLHEYSVGETHNSARLHLFRAFYKPHRIKALPLPSQTRPHNFQHVTVCHQAVWCIHMLRGWPRYSSCEVIFLWLWCVHELLSRNVETTRMLQGRRVVFYCSERLMSQWRFMLLS